MNLAEPVDRGGRSECSFLEFKFIALEIPSRPVRACMGAWTKGQLHLSWRVLKEWPLL
jgi:hypothetical protein